MARATLGSRLAEARKLGGLTARSLDGLVGLSGGYTSRIESGGTKGVGAETLSGFADVLGVSLDWLVDGRGERPLATSVVASVERARRRSAKSSVRTGTEG
jgi:transcriptional regulator with XRE-family HTH domain